MASFILSRLIRMVFTVWFIVTLVFIATRLSGNAVDFIAGEGIGIVERQQLIEYFGLNDSLWVQYWRYLASFFEGNFGISLIERRPVVTIVAERIIPSLQLFFGAVFLTLLLSIPAGIVAAIYRQSWIGSVVMSFAFIGYAVPNFILAITCVLVFSFWLGWLPSTGNGSWLHFIMPVCTLSVFYIATLTRFTRNAMLDVLNQDYLRTARAKGLKERAVIIKHALRNALIPVLSVVGLQMAGLIAAGNVVIETVFSWRGMGDLLVTSALKRDYPVLQFGVLSVAIAVVLINFLIDIAYSKADPRIRLGSTA